MRFSAQLALFILASLMLDGLSGSRAEETDWADCLSCHAEYSSSLPALKDMRSRANAPATSKDCSACHGNSPPDFLSGDWSHPVRSIGEHIGCGNCHPAVAHSAEYPPPLPRGDYRPEQCFDCHREIGNKRHALSTHINKGLTGCIDCHPPHEPLRAFIPDSLLNSLQVERRGSFQRNDISNTPCMDCHFSLDLFHGTREGFVTLNTDNYHLLHVVSEGIGCVECHDPHGSNEPFLIRGQLLSGEIMSYIPTGQGASCSVSCHGAQHDFTTYVNSLR